VTTGNRALRDPPITSKESERTTVSTSSTTPEQSIADQPDDSRPQFVAGVRAFADWLEANPQAKAPIGERFLLPLTTNDRVAEFAATHGLEVVADEHGNTSCNLTFGPIVYHAYGYADFAADCERTDEERARKWAARKGLELVAADEVTA
jgi:hypothetical protein